MSVRQLRQLIQGTLLETSDDLLDPTRPIRPKGSSTQSQLQLDELDQSNGSEDDDEDNGSSNDDDDDGEGADEELDGGETMEESADDHDTGGDKDDQEESLSSPSEESSPAPEEVEESLSEDDESSNDPEAETQQQEEPSDEQETYLDEPAGDQEELELENEPLDGGSARHTEAEEVKPSWENVLQEFDVNKFLSPSDSYLVFIPSGETIEAQFFSLLTSLWIAKHSNRTLIIPPPMMAPPSLYHLHPLFAGSKGRKRQRWSTLFDLRFISNLQQTVLMDSTRPVLQTPFTAEMAQEEENPTNATQSVPYHAPVANDEDDDITTTPAGSTIPVSIKCHGPPTAGSWKALDFAGRHFLNRYNLVAEFEILGDPYWNLKPDAISRHWRATTTAAGPGEDRHRQFICISGAELVGSENAAIEEMIWQEIGLHIPFSNAVKVQGRQSVVQVLRAVEKVDRSSGYIGVHIDKLPSREFCRHGGPRYEHLETSDSTLSGSTFPQGQDSHQQPQQQQEDVTIAEDRKEDVNGNVVAAAAAGMNPTTATASTSMTPSQCLWTVDLIAKRIALLQQTVNGGPALGRPPRPVIVTTTETDPELLSKMDQQPGWYRVGDEDDGNGLFDTAVEDLGGYGPAAMRTFVMSNSAIFVGNRASALAMHAAFRIKNEGRVKQLPPRWELY
ncbi:hypothetical protein BGX29_002298 [Mortierella sp. GBA35]|nr:hypothetical protein BGX29_002298 [Mortierella sp. GBA35]